VDHGETDTFYMNSEGDILTADTLKKWLNKIQNSTERDDYINQVIVIYDACKSGSFIDELKEIPENKERVIITSSAVNEDARFFAGYGSIRR
jgi:Peptidase C13 family.